MTEKNEALRLADALEISSNHGMRREAAAKLRRLVAQRDALLEALKKIDSCTNDPVTVAMAQVAISKAEENT